MQNAAKNYCNCAALFVPTGRGGLRSYKLFLASNQDQYSKCLPEFGNQAPPLTCVHRRGPVEVHFDEEYFYSAIELTPPDNPSQSSATDLGGFFYGSPG